MTRAFDDAVNRLSLAWRQGGPQPETANARTALEVVYANETGELADEVARLRSEVERLTREGVELRARLALSEASDRESIALYHRARERAEHERARAEAAESSASAYEERLRAVRDTLGVEVSSKPEAALVAEVVASASAARERAEALNKDLEGLVMGWRKESDYLVSQGDDSAAGAYDRCAHALVRALAARGGGDG